MSKLVLYTLAISIIYTLPSLALDTDGKARTIVKQVGNGKQIWRYTRFEKLTSENALLSATCMEGDENGQQNCFFMETTIKPSIKIANKDKAVETMSTMFNMVSAEEWRQKFKCEQIENTSFEDWLKNTPPEGLDKTAGMINTYALKATYETSLSFCQNQTVENYKASLQAKFQLTESLCQLEAETMFVKLSWDKELEKFISNNLLGDNKCRSLTYEITFDGENYNAEKIERFNIMKSCGQKPAWQKSSEFTASAFKQSINCSSISY